MEALCVCAHQGDGDELEEDEDGGEDEQPLRGEPGARVWHEALEHVGAHLVAERPVAGDGREVERERQHGVAQHQRLGHLPRRRRRQRGLRR